MTAGRPPVELGLGFADPGVCVLRKIIDCDRFRNFDLENSLIAYNQHPTKQVCARYKFLSSGRIHAQMHNPKTPPSNLTFQNIMIYSPDSIVLLEFGIQRFLQINVHFLVAWHTLTGRGAECVRLW